eukprot:SAG31_NODE_14807_length_786_cov_1.783115_1_plen_97_part_10
MVGLQPASPGFAEVVVAPKIHDSLGPRSVGGEFLSPKGLISSKWMVMRGSGGGAAGVALSVTLPIGVKAATIVVPKPMAAGKPTTTAVVVKLGGRVV